MLHRLACIRTRNDQLDGLFCCVSVDLVDYIGGHRTSHVICGPEHYGHNLGWRSVVKSIMEVNAEVLGKTKELAASADSLLNAVRAVSKNGMSRPNA